MVQYCGKQIVLVEKYNTISCWYWQVVLYIWWLKDSTLIQRDKGRFDTVYLKTSYWLTCLKWLICKLWNQTDLLFFTRWAYSANQGQVNCPCRYWPVPGNECGWDLEVEDKSKCGVCFERQNSGWRQKTPVCLWKMRLLLLVYLCAYAAWASDNLDYDNYDTVSFTLMRFDEWMQHC